MTGGGEVADWISPVAGAAVGIAGIVATVVSTKRAQDAQERAQRVSFAHEQEQELLRERRVLYAKFLAGVGEIVVLASAEQGGDAMLEKMMSNATALSLVEQEMREKGELEGVDDDDEVSRRVAKTLRQTLQSAKAGEQTFTIDAWLKRLSESTALYQEITLIATPPVVSAAGKVVSLAPKTLSGPALDLGDAIYECRLAMIAELNNQPQ